LAWRGEGIREPGLLRITGVEHSDDAVVGTGDFLGESLKINPLSVSGSGDKTGFNGAENNVPGLVGVIALLAKEECQVLIFTEVLSGGVGGTRVREGIRGRG